MTLTDLNRPGHGPDALTETPAQHHPYRWRLNRAGIVNVWYYYDTEFDLSGGRLVLRGTNGSGKSRALEMLLPFLLDGDRRKMDATGSGKVRLQDLMKAGAEGASNRVGYLWLELVRDPDSPDATGEPEYLTLGAFIRFSNATGEAKVHYFTTPRRVGHDLQLLSADRETLTRDKLTELVGADRVTESPTTHRDRVRSLVFGLTGDAGRERYDGLIQLLHTLRSPDVGNRIEEGKLPQILSDALPPLSEHALNAAGEQLDGLSETRDAQQRLEQALADISTFLGVYRRYTSTVLTQTATEARDAADAAGRTERAAADRRAEHQALVSEHTAAARQVSTLEATVEQLEAQVAGIRESKAYADARDLRERDEKVAALAKVADTALSAAADARAAEERAVTDADRAADDVLTQARATAVALTDTRTRLSAAGLAGELPETVTARTDDPVTAADQVRVRREDEPGPILRPQPVTVTVHPADLGTATAQVERVRTAATDRSRQASTRLTEAHQAARTQQHAADARRSAEEADTAADEAGQVADDRAGDAETAALTLAGQWRTWVDDPATGTAYGPDVSWETTALADVLADPETVTDPDVVDLEALDQVAGQVAVAVRDRHTRTLTDLDRADVDAAAVRADLEAEATRLRAAVDPAPAAAPWLIGDAAGTPLWRCVDFADTVPAADRAGLEGALLASGLLLAQVTPDGRVLAADGQLLAVTDGDVAPEPLSAMLRPDPASPVPAALTEAVLDRVGYGHHTHRTWVAGDGTWGNGPLTGRHRPDTARHIGAAARAAARRARLDEIDDTLGGLATAAAHRNEQRARTQTAIGLLEARVAAAPRSRPVLNARVRAADAATAAAAAARRARELRSAADIATRHARAAWASHEVKCAEFGLPADADALAEVERLARDAAGLCVTLAAQMRALADRQQRHADAVARISADRDRRRRVETDAAGDWSQWHREEAELAAVRRAVGQAAEESLRELAARQTELTAARAARTAARERHTDLTARVGAAGVAAETARDAVDTAHLTLRAAAALLRRRYQLSGVLAATGAEPVSVEMADLTTAHVRAVSEAVLASLPRVAAADENALIRALQVLEPALSGTFDVTAEVHDGVRLVDLSDASGRRSVARAAADLEQKAAEGRDALSDRERHVFTDFVLGGVSEELRRKLDQAADLVAAMNNSLETIKTSHGIGVKLRWRLADGADSTVARIRELVATAGALRNADQTAELTDLLKARVDEAFLLDSSAGYAAHLNAALDYRDWHHVEVIILGPGPGQERRISRKARLSQGETRFVSYVTLFAAVDAYLSGLPDTSRALRLLLLDDAFAKVDDRTIGELMGLLVRLDVDFVMTGHALWGTYPQVPALDCYEVRRVEGSAAVTTHVHWDGSARHLRAAR